MKNMKAAVIVFSPSGHTLGAAHMIQKSFESKKDAAGSRADIINITKDDILLYAPRSEKTKYLQNKLTEFDVLFVGAPVYAGHAESCVLRVIEALPEADAQRAKCAVPFITYGGAHSFVALEEMARALKKKNYVPVLGIKLASFHTLSRYFHTEILPNKPGDSEALLIDTAVNKVFDICSTKNAIRDNSASFAYTKAPMRFILRMLPQKKIHARFKTVSVLREKCAGCKKCVAACPINNIAFSGGKASIKNQKNCILCGECFYNCSSGAVVFEYRTLAQKRLCDGNTVLENPVSAIYPKKYGYINDKGALNYER